MIRSKYTPSYVAEFFYGIVNLQNIAKHLPLGVTQKEDGKYYAVVFFGEFFDIYHKKSFTDPSEAHKYWQEQSWYAINFINVNHNTSDMYDERIAESIKAYREMLEEDIEDDRETS